jgi:hypothetical protein
MGASTPLNVTLVEPEPLGNDITGGMPINVVLSFRGARLSPKIEIISPGASGPG